MVRVCVHMCKGLHASVFVEPRDHLLMFVSHVLSYVLRQSLTEPRLIHH